MSDAAKPLTREEEQEWRETWNMDALDDSPRVWATLDAERAKVAKLREVLLAHKNAPMLPSLNPMIVRVTLMGMTDRILVETEPEA